MCKPVISLFLSVCIYLFFIFLLKLQQKGSINTYEGKTIRSVFIKKITKRRPTTHQIELAPPSPLPPSERGSLFRSSFVPPPFLGEDGEEVEELSLCGGCSFRSMLRPLGPTRTPPWGPCKTSWATFRRAGAGCSSKLSGSSLWGEEQGYRLAEETPPGRARLQFYELAYVQT